MRPCARWKATDQSKILYLGSQNSALQHDMWPNFCWNSLHPIRRTHFSNGPKGLKDPSVWGTLQAITLQPGVHYGQKLFSLGYNAGKNFSACRTLQARTLQPRVHCRQELFSLGYTAGKSSLAWVHCRQELFCPWYNSGKNSTVRGTLQTRTLQSRYTAAAGKNSLAWDTLQARFFRPGTLQARTL